MQHTTNYDLPQWEDTDRILREDMNGAMSIIDAAMAGLSGGARVEEFHYTGQASVENVIPTVITFPEKPILFTVLGYDTFLIGVPNMIVSFTQTTELKSEMAVFPPSWNGNTVTFSSSSIQRECNVGGIVYRGIVVYA